MLAENKSGWILLDYCKIEEDRIKEFNNVTGAFAVITVNGKYLIGYNSWRKQWEFPAGGIEQGETAREAAIRELFEETHQKNSNLIFKGLFKVRKPDGATVFQAFFAGEQDELLPFVKHDGDEMDRIMLWDLKEDIGYVDECDLKMVELACMSRWAR